MPTSNEEANGSSPWLKGGLAGVTIFAVLLLVIYGLYLTIKAPMGVGEDNTGITWYAQYGDAFGVITSFFTALGTIGLVGTIILQYQTLKAQKEELSETRKEIAGQRVQLEAQTKLLADQTKSSKLSAFESGLFRLIEIDEEYRNNLKFCTQYVGFSGTPKAQLLTEDNRFEYGKKGFNSYYDVLKFSGLSSVHLLSSQSLYFFCYSIYEVLQYIDNAEIDKREKRKYANVYSRKFQSSELETLARFLYQLEEFDSLIDYMRDYSFLNFINAASSLSSVEREYFGLSNNS